GSVESLNNAARIEGLDEPVKLQVFLGAVENDPLGPESFWVLSMFVTTLFPVAAFLISLVLSPVSAQFFPVAIRQRIAHDLINIDPKTDEGPCYRAAMHLLVRSALGLTFVVVIIAGSYVVFAGVYRTFGLVLLYSAKCVLSIVDTSSLQECRSMLFGT